MTARLIPRALLGVPALLAGVAFAQTPSPSTGRAATPSPVQNVALSATLGWSDNIRGENVDQESETIAGIGLQTRIARDHRRLGYELSTDLQYLDYLGNTFDSEITGMAEFSGRAVIAPEMLTFVVQDNFGQTQTTPFAPSTPETRQNVNVLSAGPDLRLDLGGSFVMLGSGRYMLENYETTAADNARTQAQLGFYHEFSADSSLGILASSTNVEYDDGSTGIDFERMEYLARYRLSARRTAMLFEAGKSEFSADDGTEREIWLYRVNAARQLTARTFFIVGAGRELSDSGSLFVSTTSDSVQTGGGNGSSDDAFTDLGLGGTQLTGTGIVATTDSLQHEYVRATWRLNAPRTRAYLGAETREERYLQGQSANRDVTTLSVGIERNLTAALRVGLDISHNMRESAEDDPLDISLRDTMYRVSAFWLATRRMEVSLAAEHAKRSGSSTGGGFDDNRVWLRMIWAPRGAPR